MMNSHIVFAAVLLVAASLPFSSAFAQPNPVVDDAERSVLDQRTADVVAVFNGEMDAAQVFSSEFLKAVPAEQLDAMNAQLSAQFGKLLGVENIAPNEKFQAAIKLRYERAIGNGFIAVSPAEPNKVIGLRLIGFDPIDDTLGKITADIEALPGEVGVHFVELGGNKPPILSINADRQFAIGSTFKLYVLNALTRSIANGERAWDDVVRIGPKSLPSGQMHNWPDGAPVTLHTLATMMISISDNTATDTLIEEVGRSAVEGELALSGHSAPDLNTPFLTTLELFALKADLDEARRFTGSDELSQRAMIQALSARLDGKPDRANAAEWESPRMIDTLEWFATGRDIAGAMEQMVALNDETALKIMSVNSALPSNLRNQWAYAGYKGGSEPGVLNLSWLLRDKAGDWHSLTMSWNNQSAPVDNATFDLLAQRIISLTVSSSEPAP